MPLLKPIAGHTGCAGIKRYLEKGGRALGIMVMNFAWQEERAFEDVSAAPAGFDWAESMDATRRACGNDTPYRGKPARTFKHFVMSPDPQDGLTADQVAELASAWALRHFADFEAAIVLHDDNERKIPHATSSSTTPTSPPSAAFRPRTRSSSTAACRNSPRNRACASCATTP